MADRIDGPRAFAAVMIGGSVVIGVAWLVNFWQFEMKISRARERVAAGKFADAFPVLKQIMARQPPADETSFLMGVCELALGRPKSALAARYGIPVSSRFAPEARLRAGPLRRK